MAKKCIKNEDTFNIFSFWVEQKKKYTEFSILNIIIIGAGPSGLCSAKYALAHGFNVTIYDQADQLGGIWNYTEKTGKNQFGVIPSPMYRDLR